MGWDNKGSSIGINQINSMKTHKLLSFIIAALTFLVLALSFGTSSNIKFAEATAPSPGWWVDNNGSFSQYDKYQFNNGRTHQGTFYSGYGTDSNIISANASWGMSIIGTKTYVKS